MGAKSRACAEHDGIKIIEGPGRGRDSTDVFLIPCAKCGKILKRLVYSSDKEYLCDYCKLQLKRKKKAAEALNDVRTKNEVRFDQAIEKIGKQTDVSKYENAIRIARQRCEQYGSIPEAMVAIELIHAGYKIIPQQKVGKYRVDFCIPDSHLVIEVDGGIYHAKENPGRDGAINLALGLEWHIMHVPADWISKHIASLDYLIGEFFKNCNTGEK